MTKKTTKPKRSTEDRDPSRDLPPRLPTGAVPLKNLPSFTDLALSMRDGNHRNGNDGPSGPPDTLKPFFERRNVPWLAELPADAMVPITQLELYGERTGSRIAVRLAAILKMNSIAKERQGEKARARIAVQQEVLRIMETNGNGSAMAFVQDGLTAPKGKGGR